MSIVDRPDITGEGSRTPAWLKPSQALGRFEPSESLHLQAAEKGRSRARFGYRVGSLSFLIPLGAGSEVVPLSSPAAIPNSPDWLLGIVNLRGSLVPVFDLARLVGVDGERPVARVGAGDAKTMILVLGKSERAAGLLIEGLPVALSDLRPTQSSAIDDRLQPYVTDAFASNEEFWFELNHEPLLTRLTQTGGL